MLLGQLGSALEEADRDDPFGLPQTVDQRVEVGHERRVEGGCLREGGGLEAEQRAPAVSRVQVPAQVARPLEALGERGDAA